MLQPKQVLCIFHLFHTQTLADTPLSLISLPQSPPPQNIQNLLRRRLGPDHRVNSPVRRQRLPGLGPPTLLPSDSTPSSTPTNSGTPPLIPQSSTVPPDRRAAGETLPLPEMRVAANISSDHRRNRSLQIRPLGAPRLFSLNSRDFFLSICLVLFFLILFIYSSNFCVAGLALYGEKEWYFFLPRDRKYRTERFEAEPGGRKLLLEGDRGR